jgi:hypothetical protein
MFMYGLSVGGNCGCKANGEQDFGLYNTDPNMQSVVSERGYVNMLKSLPSQLR